MAPTPDLIESLYSAPSSTALSYCSRTSRVQSNLADHQTGIGVDRRTDDLLKNSYNGSQEMETKGHYHCLPADGMVHSMLECDRMACLIAPLAIVGWRSWTAWHTPIRISLLHGNDLSLTLLNNQDRSYDICDELFAIFGILIWPRSNSSLMASSLMASGSTATTGSTA